MRVLVCGSRDYKDETFVWSVLSGLYQLHSTGWMTVLLAPFTVIEGQCPYGGADKFAETWCKNSPLHGPLVGEPNPWEACPVEHLPFPADWKRYGKAAGGIRNQQMLDEGKPELVLAFVNKPIVESSGTWDMVRRSRNLHVPTHVLESMG